MLKAAWLGIGIALVAWSPSVSAQISKNEYPEMADTTPVSAEDILPPDFKGQVTYSGLYRGKAVGAATRYRSLPMAGEYIVVMEFDGPNVSGSMRTVDGLANAGQHATPDSGRFQGTREAATCHLSWSDGTNTVTYCGRANYRESVNSPSPTGDLRVAYGVTGRATQFVDYIARDREQKAAAALAARAVPPPPRAPVQVAAPARRPVPSAPKSAPVSSNRPAPPSDQLAMARRCLTVTPQFLPDDGVGGFQEGIRNNSTTHVSLNVTCGTEAKLKLKLGRNYNGCHLVIVERDGEKREYIDAWLHGIATNQTYFETSNDSHGWLPSGIGSGFDCVATVEYFIITKR